MAMRQSECAVVGNSELDSDNSATASVWLTIRLGSGHHRGGEMGRRRRFPVRMVLALTSK
jgi:hypothetical protein